MQRVEITDTLVAETDGSVNSKSNVTNTYLNMYINQQDAQNSV